MKSKMITSVQIITPAIAKEMLATSCGNRNIRSWYVLALSDAMKRGEWRPTCQGIGFDINGHLRDGHHRLSAIINADISIEMNVTYGMTEDSYLAIDQGKKRNVGDVLNTGTNIAAVLRLSGQYLYSTNPSMEQVKEISDTSLKSVVEELYRYCPTKRKYFTSAPVGLSACLLILDGHDKGYIFQQYRALALIDFDSMSTASRAYERQYALGKISSINARDTLARGLKVFDISRREILKIQVSEAEITAANEYARTVLRSTLERSIP